MTCRVGRNISDRLVLIVLKGFEIVSVRKRNWTTAKGEVRQSWVVDYVDGAGKRRLKTFERKKDADAYRSQANVEVSQGVYTPDSQSVTVAEAANLWLTTCRGRGLERSTLAGYEQTFESTSRPRSAVRSFTQASRLSVPSSRLPLARSMFKRCSTTSPSGQR